MRIWQLTPHNPPPLQSHYIGPLNEKAYLAFDQGYGNAPFNYVQGYPHDGWRHMLPYMITMWKTGTAVVTEEVLTAWYRLTPSSACGSGGTTGNNPQYQTRKLPQNVSPDRIYFAALLTGLANPYVTFNGVRRSVTWDSAPDYAGSNYVGVYFGSFDTGGESGSVKIELVANGGAVVATLNGESIKSSCPNGVQNWNAWVGSAKGSRSVSATSPKTNLNNQTCVEGAGTKQEFNEFCKSTCRFGYCPPGPCVCYKMGINVFPLEPEYVDGYPLPGSDCTYKGLCSWGCNHGICPTDKCTTDPDAKDKCVIPEPPVDPNDDNQACTSGEGDGNFGGLCGFSCGRGFCPEGPCRCTGRGPKITPPAATMPRGYAVLGSGLEQRKDLCEFACARDYCPSGACTYENPFPGMFFEIKDEVCDKSDPMWWSCDNLTCAVAGDPAQDAIQRWKSVNVEGFFNRTLKWYAEWNDFSTAGDPWKDQYFKNNPLEAVTYFWAGENAKGGRAISQRLNCHLLTAAGACSNPLNFACGTTRYPALDLLLQSASNMHNYYSTMMAAYQDSQMDLQAKVKRVAESFYEQSGKSLEIFRKVLSIFAWMLTIIGGQFFSELFRVGAFTGSIDTASGALDTFTQSFELVAGGIQDKVQTLAQAQSALEGVVDVFYQGAKDSLDEWMKKSFVGSYMNYQRLYDHVKDGLFLDPPDVSERDLSKTVSRVVTAKSILQSWKYSAPIAIIWEQGKKAKPGYSLINLDSDAAQMRVEVPDGDYTLWVVHPQECQGSGGGDDKSCLNGARKPYNIDKIQTKTDEWEVTKADFALASFYAAMRAEPPQALPLVMPKAEGLDKNKFSGIDYGAGMRTPGMYRIPTCSTATFHRNVWKQGVGPLESKSCPYYPCCENI